MGRDVSARNMRCYSATYDAAKAADAHEAFTPQRDSSPVETLPVDLLLPKQRGAGSSPVSRSKPDWSRA